MKSQHTSLAQPAHPAARERQQLGRRLLREASLELARLRRTRGAYRKTWRRISRARARLAFAAALLAAPLAEPALAGTPTFVSPVSILNVGSFASPDFADIDGDGDLDAFVSERYGRTIFFANTGTASASAFAAPFTNPFGLPAFEFSLALADIDADSDLDAFGGGSHCLPFICAPVMLFSRNTGTESAPAFAAPSSSPPFDLLASWPPNAPAFADLDGDGDLDAFIGNHDGATIFQRNTGTTSTPAFAAPSTNPFGLADVGYDASPAFADLDGDGDLDAFVGNRDGYTIFFGNTGTASAPAFAAPSTSPFGLAYVGFNASPAFADIDGDGDLDAFVGESYGNTFFFENVEVGPGTCADGLDNDFDGRIDSPSDPGCANAADPNERSSKQCDNGLDDDNDGKIDWRGDATGDPHCVSLTDNNESTPPPPSWGCGVGPELLLLGPLLAAARRRRSSAAPRPRREA